MTKTILIVVTNHDRLGDTGKPTGLWLEELATPRARFLEAGYAVALASPLGGKTPIDPASLSDEAANDDTRAFLADDSAMAELESTAALNTLHPDRYDAVFCVGGHGTVFDFPDCRPLAGLATQFIASDRPFAAVCHGVAALLDAESAGEPLVRHRRLTAFSDKEEEMVGLTKAVPFLLETRLRELGAELRVGEPWQPEVVIDGSLMTGRNPASSGPLAEAVIAALAKAGDPG